MEVKKKMSEASLAKRRLTADATRRRLADKYPVETRAWRLANGRPDTELPPLSHWRNMRMLPMTVKKPKRVLSEKRRNVDNRLKNAELKAVKAKYSDEEIKSAKIKMHDTHLHFVDHLKPLPAPAPAPAPAPKKLSRKKQKNFDKTAPAREARLKKIVPK